MTLPKITTAISTVFEREVFLDAGYLIGLEDTDDANHLRARRHWEGLVEFPGLRTTSYVLDEVVTFFNTRGSHQKAVEVGERLLQSPSIEVVHVGEALLRWGLDYLRRRQDKRYSLTDCISFVVMGERGITTAYAFDDHFTQAGFVKEP